MFDANNKMTHLWEMDTHWFNVPKDEYMNCTFHYKNWKDFKEYKPYKLWKPYILSSWSWKLRNVDEVKKQKRQQTTGIMDCSTMLRASPSSYDKEKPFLDTSKPHVEMLQIVFISPERFAGVHRVEMSIQKEDEEEVRDWLKRHMPTFWKL